MRHPSSFPAEKELLAESQVVKSSMKFCHVAESISSLLKESLKEFCCYLRQAHDCLHS